MIGGIRVSKIAFCTLSVREAIFRDALSLPKAISERKAEGAIPEGYELRQVNYLNTVVQHDHHFITRRVKPGLGFFSFESAGNTVQGYERRNMMRKVQVHSVEKGNVTAQVAFITSLFGVAA